MSLQLLAGDFRRKQAIFHQDGASASLLRIIASDGSSAMILYRLAQSLSRWRLSPLVYLALLANKWLNGCVIGAGADFGEGFVIMHPVGIVINSKVRGGKNITLESGVVIGDEKGVSPVLHNDIFVGAGAKIFGPVVIEGFVKIGANAVVVKNAPQGKTVVGIPGRVLEKGV